MVLYENYLILHIHEFEWKLKKEGKTLGKLVSKGEIRPSLNTYDILLWV